MTNDFWSRRRAAVAEEEQKELAAQARATEEAVQAELEAKSDDEILSELELKEPEALESSEEIRNFMKHELPQRLKDRALRHLWRLNPVLANLDGLVDYGGDFTDASTVIENLQTTYRVGKGMLAHLEAQALPDQDIGQDQDSAVEEGLEVDAEGDELVAVKKEAALEDAKLDGEADTISVCETQKIAKADPYVFVEETDPQNAPIPVSRRHMTFNFEAQT